MLESTDIESLKARHTSLERTIAAEEKRPRPDEHTLHRLKVEKLRIKDRIERLKTEAATV